MKKKLFTGMILVLALLLSLTACTSGMEGGTTTTEPTTQSTEETTTTPESTKAIVEEPTEITMFFQTGGQTFPDGFDQNDNYYFNRICELANIVVTELTVPAYADTKTQFELMMSSGDIPDLVERYDPTSMKQYGEDGAFLPTEDIIRNSSVLSEQYNDIQIEAMKSSDGVAYIIEAQPKNDDYSSMWVRMDLLDELELDVPTTLDDWVEAARALKQKYPDSIPFVGRGDIWGYMWICFAPFGLNNNGIGWYYNFNSGKVVNAFEGDNIVDAMIFSRQLYDEGLLDPEFLTTNSSDYVDKKMYSNALVHYNNFGTLQKYVTSYFNNDQTEVRLIPVNMPVAEEYEYNLYRSTDVLLGYCFGINAKSDEETLGASVRFLEELYSDEVRELAIYGQEGVDFEWINDEATPIYPAATENSFISLYAWMFINCQEMLSYKTKTAVYATDALSDEEKDEYYSIISEADTEVRNTLYGKVGYDPTALAAASSDEMVNRGNECKEEQKSLLAKVVMGEMTIDDFIIEKEKILEEYQDVTDAYNELAQAAKEKYNLDQYGFMQ